MDGAVILIVEDNEKSLKLVRDLLQHKGFRTLEATTGAAGVALARAHRPDLVLMDIQLPDIKGSEALAILRADHTTVGIPVVAFTASAMAGDRERLLATGFDGYLAKPIDIKIFPEQVEQYRRQGRREP